MKTLEEAVAFRDWRGRNSLGQELFIVGFRPHGDELAGWRMDSLRRSELNDGTHLLSSIWTDRKATRGERIVIQVRECASRLAAHDQMLDMLATELPIEDYQQRDALGDVAISWVKTSLVFARANLAVSLVSAGKRPADVTEAAQNLDALLTSSANDVTPLPGVAQGITSIEVRTEPEARVTLGRVNDSGLSLPGDPWFKFFSPAGRMFVEMGLLFWLPDTGGDQTVLRVSVTRRG